MKFSSSFLALLGALITSAFPAQARTRPVVTPEALRVHGIFRSHMVLQRDEPITIWGWAPEGKAVTLGEEEAQASPTGEAGSWQVSESLKFEVFSLKGTGNRRPKGRTKFTC